MYTQEQLMQMLAAHVAAVVLIGLLLIVIAVVSLWRIFNKAGQAGWKSLIPVYNTYVCYKIAWKPVMFFAFLVLTFVGNMCYITGGEAAGAVGIIALLAAGIVSIMYNYKLARAFGKGLGYTLGLLFLNPVFMLLLAFGGASYRGADS